ncbi:unnamed protein product [Prunus brigantina]
MNATYQVPPLLPKTTIRDHIDFLMEITKKEGIVDVKLMERPIKGDGKSNHLSQQTSERDGQTSKEQVVQVQANLALGADGDEGMRAGITGSTMESDVIGLVLDDPDGVVTGEENICSRSDEEEIAGKEEYTKIGER